MSKLPTNVGTSDEGVVDQSAGRGSGLPTYVGTSDRWDSRCTSGLPTRESEASQWKVPELPTVRTPDTRRDFRHHET